jgi:hypothetical protein
MPVREFGKRASAAGLGGLWIVGAPWWTIFLLIMTGFAVVGLQTVIPQESAHRLAWWHDLREARRVPRQKSQTSSSVSAGLVVRHRDADVPRRHARSRRRRRGRG